MTVERVICLYPRGVPAACRECDPRAPAVAERVVSSIQGRLPRVRVEHVGSTAVPGCAGKGVVDLLALYRDAASWRRFSGRRTSLASSASARAPRSRRTA